VAQTFIADPDTGKNVAIIRDGEVFRDDTEGARIATVLGAYLYDLKGNLVGYLHRGQVIDASTQAMPVAFRRLLAGPLCGEKSPARAGAQTGQSARLGLGGN
jgi:hypothetical protein